MIYPFFFTPFLPITTFTISALPVHLFFTIFFLYNGVYSRTDERTNKQKNLGVSLLTYTLPSLSKWWCWLFSFLSFHFPFHLLPFAPSDPPRPVLLSLILINLQVSRHSPVFYLFSTSLLSSFSFFLSLARIYSTCVYLSLPVNLLYLRLPISACETTLPTSTYLYL